MEASHATEAWPPGVAGVRSRTETERLYPFARTAVRISRPWVPVVALGLAVRLATSTFLGHPYDFEIWRTYWKLVWSFDVNALFWWSQGPLGLITMVVSQSPLVLVEGLGLDLQGPLENLVLHAPFLAGDLLLAYALWSSLARYARPWATPGLISWALLPGFWWIPAGHGQFDAWVPATTLLAVLAAAEGRWRRAGVWLGIGFGFKYVPILLLPGLLLIAWQRGRARSTLDVLGCFLVTATATLVPLVATASTLGPGGALRLLWERVSWWSTGSESVLSASLLAGAVSSPYPVLLDASRRAGVSATQVELLPPLLVALGIMVALGWLVRSQLKSSHSVPSPRNDLERLLAYAALTLLFVGGLSQVAVIQRVYWALLPMLVLAVVSGSRLAVGLTLAYSSLILLPEWLSTSPLLYLRAPFDDLGLRLVTDVGAITGWGQSLRLAELLGAAIVPFGVLAVLAAMLRGSASRVALAVAAALTAAALLGGGLVLAGTAAASTLAVAILLAFSALLYRTGYAADTHQPPLVSNR